MAIKVVSTSAEYKAKMAKKREERQRIDEKVKQRHAEGEASLVTPYGNAKSLFDETIVVVKPFHWNAYLALVKPAEDASSGRLERLEGRVEEVIKGAVKMGIIEIR